MATVIASGMEPAPGLAPPYRFTLGDAAMVVLSDGPFPNASIHVAENDVRF